MHNYCVFCKLHLETKVCYCIRTGIPAHQSVSRKATEAITNTQHKKTSNFHSGITNSQAPGLAFARASIFPGMLRSLAGRSVDTIVDSAGCRDQLWSAQAEARTFCLPILPYLAQTALQSHQEQICKTGGFDQVVQTKSGEQLASAIACYGLSPQSPRGQDLSAFAEARQMDQPEPLSRSHCQLAGFRLQAKART